MSMTAQDFLELLQGRGVMSPSQIDDLREQLDAAGGSVHPVFVARRLVQEGFLNPYFAKNLLAEGGSSPNGPPGIEERDLELADEAQETTANFEPDPEELAPPDFELNLPPLDADSWVADAPQAGMTLGPARMNLWNQLLGRRGAGPLGRETPRWLVALIATAIVVVVALLAYIIL